MFIAKAYVFVEYSKNIRQTTTCLLMKQCRIKICSFLYFHFINRQQTYDMLSVAHLASIVWKSERQTSAYRMSFLYAAINELNQNFKGDDYNFFFRSVKKC